MKRSRFWIKLLIVTITVLFLPINAYANTSLLYFTTYIMLTPADNNSVIHVSGAVEVYSNNTQLYDISILCEPGTQLTLRDVNIDNSVSGIRSPVYFMGTGIQQLNGLILQGTNRLVGSSGNVATLSSGKPGVQVVDSTYLFITGSGSLYATGGENSAGIGSYSSLNCGNIFIEMQGGYINATGGVHGAGIGGGLDGDAGYIEIISGTVIAYAGYYAAGIGGGNNGNGGYIVIRDGNIAAHGHNAPGIGSGYSAGVGDIYNVATGMGGGYVSGGKILIEGGVVQAYSTGQGAGIGYWYENGSDDIHISGGVVYAASGNPAVNDIGNCDANIPNTSNISISGSSIVFVKNGLVNPTPSTNHTYEDNLMKGNSSSVYGMPIPSGWMDPIRVYYSRVSTISYDAAGGTGNLPASITQFPTTTINVADPGNLYKSGYDFICWDESNSGSQNNYYVGETCTFGSYDKTLYAQWDEIKVNTLLISESGINMMAGQYVNISVEVLPSDALNTDVIWSSDNTAVALVNPDGTIVAMSEGTATILVTSVSDNMVTDNCTVQVIPSSMGDPVLQRETFYVGESINITELLSSDDSKINDIGWISTNPKVASVDAKGWVVCKETGSAEIIALSKKSKSAVIVFAVNIVDDENGVQDRLKDFKNMIGNFLDKPISELWWVLVIAFVCITILLIIIGSKLRRRK